MGEETRKPTWREALSAKPASQDLGLRFFERYGQRPWLPAPSDLAIAHRFRVELVSRVATRRLGYGRGVEGSALASIHALFEKAREVTQGSPEATTVNILIWHVLNVHIRPFTAKWHLRDQAGLLHALDAGDEFRGDLQGVQKALRALDDALHVVLGEEGYEPVDDPAPDAVALDLELDRSVAWRPLGQADPMVGSLAAAERSAVLGRQALHGVSTRTWAAGLALSGGGIRSATFATGVLASLSRRNVLAQIDYLSTVSGGGYAGAFLTQLIASSQDRDLGLGREQEPFLRREGESSILKSLRQRARYLTGSFWERVFLALRQAHGLFVNLLILLVATATFAYVESLVRLSMPSWSTAALAVAFPILAIMLFAIFGRRLEATGTKPGPKHVALGTMFLIPPLWYLLGLTHSGWDLIRRLLSGGGQASLDILSTVSVTLLSALAIGLSVAAISVRLRAISVALVTVLTALVVENAMYGLFAGLCPLQGFALLLGLTFPAGLLAWSVDVNLTSLHRYYRSKLAAAFLMNRDGTASVPIKLSAIDTSRIPFPILNCALNVPGSRAPSMRGRLSDVFSFTPVTTGAVLVGHTATREWEAADPDLDLGTAMALSGAAASPLMGLRTTRLGSFWLTLLNVRLGAWLKRPAKTGGARPRLPYLFREFAATADETLPFLHVSDGGHIENLGIYELLRRRCRYIVSVDGENDPAMTFHALTNLQRLAYIDFGVVIEIDLDDLRLGDQGFSRSHFRFCRIRYPASGISGREEIGYLVYLKLSLTGNEGEFIRRYRLDEPSFPHHPTANQFFTEPQFEAYRALGEHIGEKLFLGAIVGEAGATEDVDLEAWMKALGRALL